MFNYLSAQQFGKDLLRNIQDNIRKIPEIWRMMTNKIRDVFEKLPINWHKVWLFIEAHFWELLILIVALAVLGMVLRFCKKVIRVVLSVVSLATCAYCIYVMFF